MEAQLWMLGVAVRLGVVFANEDGTLFLPACDGRPCFEHGIMMLRQLSLN